VWPVRRLAAILLALVALPVVGWHDAHPPPPSRHRIWIRDLMPDLAALPTRLGPFTLQGAWQILGDDEAIGNYSALGVLSDGHLATLSDRGTLLTMTRPDRPGPWRVHSAAPLSLRTAYGQEHSDGEAMVILPPDDDVLLIYESTPDMLRFSRDLRHHRAITVPALAAWPQNQGPEASMILRDGRMVMLEEGYDPWWDATGHQGLIFPGLPHSGAQPQRFRLVLPEGWRPTELANLPDGRLLLLERRFTLTGFRTALALIDPAAIRPGAVLRPRELARITDPRIRDNYEGMTVTREPDGSDAVWIISDSNAMVWFQRTLLLKLRLEATDLPPATVSAQQSFPRRRE
jgi:hypothetical protein